MNEGLQLTAIGKRYPGLPRPVLHSVELRLRWGEQLVITGRSGSGKTTLLNILGLLVRPDSGKLCFDGQNALKWKEHERRIWRRDHIGFVFQRAHLVPELTVLDNVNLPTWLAGRNRGQTPAAELLARVGLRDRLFAYPRHLSGGERQRVGVARALANRPSLIVADEPTGDLDPDTGMTVLKLLLDMQKEYSASLVLASHDPLVVEYAAGRCVRLEQGSLWRQGEGEQT